MKFSLFIASIVVGLVGSAGLRAESARPNVLFIFVDDSGLGDYSCYGSGVKDADGNPITPNIDRLAAGGTRFTDGHVASPICSPSRTGMLTGTEPARHAIYSFLDNKAANNSRNMNHWLQPDTVTSARIFRDAGYRTGQFGKWHMGGGRDVNDAPFPQEYGFQASLVAFEGMGDRVLYNGDSLSQANADVPGAITWAEWEQGAPLHTNAAISFIKTAVEDGKPFFVHVPYNDTHSPYNVEPGHENDFAHITSDTTGKLFLGELHALDKQVGRLLDTIDELGIAENTLVLLIGDNGAPNDALNTLLTRNGGLRGGKGSLWEGGIRTPFIARMTGTVPAGVVNDTTAISTLDLLPTYCALAGITPPAGPYAGEDMTDVLKGSARLRNKPLFWEYGTVSNITINSPKLAIREGNVKFLRDPEGTKRQFFLMDVDKNEANNLVDDPAYAAVIAPLEEKLLHWYDEVVLGEVGEVYQTTSSPAGVVIADSYDTTANSGTGFGTDGVNKELGARLTGQLAGSLSYLQTSTAKAASAHSIQGNALVVASAAGATAFQLSGNGTTAYDLGDHLRGRRYQWSAKLDLDDPVVANARMTLGIADSSSPADGVGGHDLAVQLDLVAGNTISVFKRVDAGSNSGAADINAAIKTGLPAGVPVKVRVVLEDSTDYTAYLTKYEIFINDVSVNTGTLRFANGSRFLIFDVAPGTGPASYDDLSIETLNDGPAVNHRLPMVRISETAPVEGVSGIGNVRLYWTTKPGQTNTPLVSSDLHTWTPLLKDGAPVAVTTQHGTIAWQEVEVPEGYQQKAFFKLAAED